MCGITGIYNLSGNPIADEEISRQIATIVHRGPNQGAIYVSEQRECGLGIRRLSIIDVTGGHQPLSNEDASIHLVYNGETYNHQALRIDLEKLLEDESAIFSRDAAPSVRDRDPRIPARDRSPNPNLALARRELNRIGEKLI